jgi:hypothetical protein
MAPTLLSTFSIEGDMKRLRRYAARAVLFAVLVAASPFAITKILADALFDFVVALLDSLEVIANDD